MKAFGFEVFLGEPIVHYKESEDNSRAIELALLPKMHPCNKHINVVFHHFRDYVRKVLIHIQQISTNYQCADAWNNPFPHNILLKHRKIFFGL